MRGKKKKLLGLASSSHLNLFKWNKFKVVMNAAMNIGRLHFQFFFALPSEVVVYAKYSKKIWRPILFEMVLLVK